MIRRSRQHVSGAPTGHQPAGMSGARHLAAARRYAQESFGTGTSGILPPTGCRRASLLVAVECFNQSSFHPSSLSVPKHRVERSNQPRIARVIKKKSSCSPVQCNRVYHPYSATLGYHSWLQPCRSCPHLIEFH
jgi:hypothetical protein